MPLSKYYCDYCDKQFQDTPSARKRHLQGVQHQRAKSIYYNTYSSQPPLPQPVHHRSLPPTYPSQNAPMMMGLGMAPNLGNHMIGRTDMVKNKAGISWGNLPPSLRPPPPEAGYPPLPVIDWA